MSLTVEDGSGLANANGYVSVADADAYHAARGTAAWAGTSDVKGAAIVRATAYIDAAYRARFPGYRARRRLQSLEWPRVGACTYVPDDGRSDGFYFGSARSQDAGLGYDYLPSNLIPRELVAATCEAALRELVVPGTLAPDLTRADWLKVFEVGPVHFEYFGTGGVGTMFQAIDLALASLLLPASPFSARAVRG